MKNTDLIFLKDKQINKFIWKRIENIETSTQKKVYFKEDRSTNL